MSDSDARWTWGGRAGNPSGIPSTATPASGSWPGGGTSGGGDSGDDEVDLLRMRVAAALEADYAVEEELGRGGMAVVYRATERSTGRTVALKVVRGDLLKDPEARGRFEREAALTRELAHPHLVQTYAVHAVPPRGMALVLEYVGGGTLKARVRREGPLSVAEVVRLLTEVASALAYAHARGIVHRDLKPENVFLDAATGAAKLGDFGIARAAGADTLTLTGTVIGTPAYMSPEQIDGRAVDARSDVYSLGLLGWELLTGEQPWAGETLFSIIKKQSAEELPPLGRYRQDVPLMLSSLLNRCLAKRPEGRLRDAAVVLSILEPGRKAPAKPESASNSAHTVRWQPPTKSRVEPQLPAGANSTSEVDDEGESPESSPNHIAEPAVSLGWVAAIPLAIAAGVAVIAIAAANGGSARSSKYVRPDVNRDRPSSAFTTSMPYASPAETPQPAIVMGVVEVSVNTPAAVSIRDASTGAVQLQQVTDAVRLELPIGVYDIEIAHEFAGREVKRVSLAPDRRYSPVRVTLPLTGTLAVAALDGWASVVLDEREVGETPLELADVPIGPHTLRYTWPDGTITSEAVVVRGGQMQRITPSRD